MKSSRGCCAPPASPSSSPSTRWIHSGRKFRRRPFTRSERPSFPFPPNTALAWTTRSEEHTSELQSHSDLVCRLLLEKKKKKKKPQRNKINTSKYQIKQHTGE